MYSILQENVIYLCFILIILIIAVLIFRKRRSRCREILLIGCCQSGKTVLFARLLYNKAVLTYSSIIENSDIYAFNKLKIRITDIPGSERIRRKLIDEHKNNAQGIIFVIDSVSIQTELRDVAELLYTLLIDPVIKSNCKELIIVCNKQDLPLAKGPAVVQLLLEKELNILRSLKNKQLESTDDEGSKKIPYLGYRKKEFQFTQLKPINVSFTESISINDEETEINIDGIKRWLLKF